MLEMQAGSAAHRLAQTENPWLGLRAVRILLVPILEHIAESGVAHRAAHADEGGLVLLCLAVHLFLGISEVRGHPAETELGRNVIRLAAGIHVFCLGIIYLS